jgi:hypothetical protein
MPETPDECGCGGGADQEVGANNDKEAAVSDGYTISGGEPGIG